MFLEDKSKLTGISADPLTAARENRGKLIDLLRDSSRWPEGFAWRYMSCRTCAMGLAIATGMFGETARLAHAAWREDDKVAAELRTLFDPVIAMSFTSERGIVARVFGLSADDATATFASALAKIGCETRVLPEHVAALLEAAPYVL